MQISRELIIPEAAEAPNFHRLNERQQNFVLALVQFGSGPGARAKCAASAGYAGTDNYLRVQAHRLFHNKAVQAALTEVTDAHLGSFKLFAIQGIASMADSARDESVKLRAFLALADRTGYSAVQRIDVKHEDVNKTNDQILDGMVAVVVKNPALLANIPEPRRSQVEAKIALLQKPDPVTDAVDVEFTTVERDPDADILGE